MPATQSDAFVHDELAHAPAPRDLMMRLADARQSTDDLFAIVKPDSLYDRPIAERHRIIFYIGHLEAFDWNLFHERVFGLKSFHPEFDRLFSFGIDPVGGGLPTDQPSDWPSLTAVRDYVRTIRSALDAKLSQALADAVPSAAEGFPLSTYLNVAIEHRLMHAETLAYMLHQLPLEKKVPFVESLTLISPAVTQRSIEIPAGKVTLGLPRDTGVFGWDNEYESFVVDVPAFAIDQFQVTNGQYLEFMKAGGYETPEFWNANEPNADNNRTDTDKNNDWDWKSSHQISHPAFWRREGNQWLYRTMFNEVPLPMSWPVYVSQAEAKAFARWAGKSLPTEAEWQRAAYAAANGNDRQYPWGSAELSAEPSSELSAEFSPQYGNFDFARWSPTPVNAFPHGQSAFGVHGMLVNGWEWTATEFAPFPGFEPFPFYRGYSADFFDGKHFVLKGGSARTAACMLRPSFRNWFQAHYQFAYTGFRCVKR
jgi:ergothioneine biosynthesis protein EgtB